jgi:hypothetical protein
MKKLIIFLFGLLLVSCVSDVKYLEQEMKELTYANAFEQAFGKISPTQTWGFNQSVGTRSAQPNSNQWGTNDDNGKYKDWPRPADITPEERAKVLAVFNQKGEAEYEALFDTDKFFVQQVYCGPEGNKMTQLAAYDKDGHNYTIYPDGNPTVVFSHEDEVNNFNNGKYSGNAEQGCMLMWYSSTLDWSYKSTQGGGQRFHYFRMEEIDGNYYVGLDFASERQAAANENEQFDRDYIYNDWIVKIVPGKGFTPPVIDKVKEEGMIICEDLGTIGDFDFNDVVFYAKVWESGMTEITLLAAGGTLNLTVAGQEVHKAFGVPQTTMVNTEESTGKGATKDPFYFVAEKTYSRLIDIPVVVSTKNNAGNVTSYELSAGMGKAPQKICVPKGFRWCKEYKSLSIAYPGFREWTTGTSDTWATEYNENLVVLTEFNF